VPDFHYEDKVRGLVCGIDEAGRGPLAGPVVAAAVLLRREAMPDRLHEILNDSKKMSAKARDEAFALLPICASIGVGEASPQEIDQVNILQATFLAMSRAFDALTKALGQPIDWALIDGNRPPKLPCQIRCLVGGDGLSFSIAAASVVAKVTRDRIMQDLARQFPLYGWERNAAYPTADHRAAILAHGLTPHHRRSFKPCKLAE